MSFRIPGGFGDDYKIQHRKEKLSSYRTAWSLAVFYGVTAGGIAVTAALATPMGGWCEEKETAVVCFRNWANASGNVFAVVAASVAAAFAFGQWRAASKQGLIAMLPALKENFESARDLLDLLRDVQFELKMTIDSDKTLRDIVADKTSPAELVGAMCDALSLRVDALDEAIAAIAKFDRRRLLFTELEYMYEKLCAVCISIQVRIASSKSSANLISRIAGISKGRTLNNLRVSIPQPDLKLLDDARVSRISSANLLQEIYKQIEKSADVAFMRRSQALAD